MGLIKYIPADSPEELFSSRKPEFIQMPTRVTLVIRQVIKTASVAFVVVTYNKALHPIISHQYVMKTSLSRLILVIAGLYVASCFRDTSRQPAELSKGSYGYDAAFLSEHLDHVAELTNEEGARVLVTGDYQGRVMTSSAGSDSGNSFGWINYELISAGKKLSQFNPVGGEERFWIGPEGGQNSFYFRKGDTFEFKNWQVPPSIDTLPFKVVSSGKDNIVFSHATSLENHSGSRFDLEINRSISLLGSKVLSERLGQKVPANIKWVAYETENTVKNTGKSEWTRETGLLSVWLLGMFSPSDETVAIIPFRHRPDAGNFITDNYFGQIPPDRLIRKDSVILLKCDGKRRSKIGLSPLITKPVAASFDYKKNILTFILFAVDTNGDYVNSKWEIQDNPYKGDAVNAYNDGPLENGSQMGPFYELESSSSAKALKPGESFTYKQVTCHMEGDYDALNTLAQNLLGISLEKAKLP